jgi:hypothetical protein
MKKHLIIATAFIALTACNTPAEREAIVNPSGGNIMELSALTEITGAKKTVLVNSKKEEIKAMDPSLNQVKAEGKLSEVLEKVTTEAKKEELEKHMATGAVALLVLPDQIKIYKVVSEVDLNLNYDVLSFQYLSRMKAYNKSSDVAAKAMIAREMQDLKYASPKSLGEKSGLVELTSIAIKRYGTLENVRTDYGEKKSILDISAKPFDMATHIELGDEIKPASTESSEEATEETAAN